METLVNTVLKPVYSTNSRKTTTRVKNEAINAYTQKLACVDTYKQILKHELLLAIAP